MQYAVDPQIKAAKMYKFDKFYNSFLSILDWFRIQVLSTTNYNNPQNQFKI